MERASSRYWPTTPIPIQRRCRIDDTTITQPPSGQGTLAISADKRSMTYTPPSSTFEGNFTFQYTIRDSAGLTSSVTSSISVNITSCVILVSRSIRAICSWVQTVSTVSFSILMCSRSRDERLRIKTVNFNMLQSSDRAFVASNLAPGDYQLLVADLPFVQNTQIPGQCFFEAD